MLYADVSEHCSETSAYKIQTPGNHSKERIQMKSDWPQTWTQQCRVSFPYTDDGDMLSPAH